MPGLNDLILFVIDNGKLDDLFLGSSTSHQLDYKNIHGDTFYALPSKYYDRFCDMAISNGFDEGEDFWKVDSNGDQIEENKMKLSLKEKKLVKEYVKKLIQENQEKKYSCVTKVIRGMEYIFAYPDNNGVETYNGLEEYEMKDRANRELQFVKNKMEALNYIKTIR